MITPERKSGLKRITRGIEKHNRALEELRADLAYELLAAKGEGATLEELGSFIGVSRQRIHQLVKKADA